MTQPSALPLNAGAVDPPATAPRSAVDGGRDVAVAWPRPGPLAWLTPLAVNWPAGWAAR